MIRRVGLWMIVLAIGLMSCEKEDIGAGIKRYQSVVTYDEQVGRQTRFLFQEIDDSREVELYVNGSFNPDQVKKGQRLLMTYGLPKGAQYGVTDCTVEFYALQRIHTPKLTIGARPDDATMEQGAIAVTTLYRSGHYLNLQAEVPVEKGRRFAVVADETTVDDDVVDLYLYTAATTNDPSYDIRTIASVDIADVWNKEQCKGVRVMVVNSANPYMSEFKFEKK